MTPFPADESSSDRNGFISHQGEWHALVLGFGAGFTGVFPSRKLRDYTYRVLGTYEDEVTLAMAEARSESWYAVGGVLLGAFVAILTLAIPLYLLGWVLGDGW